MQVYIIELKSTYFIYFLLNTSKFSLIIIAFSRKFLLQYCFNKIEKKYRSIITTSKI